MTKDSDNTGESGYSDAWRARVFADLDAYRAEEQRSWGGIDEMMLARYESGVSTVEERARVEQAMRDHPAIRKSVELARVLASEWQAGPSPPIPEFRPEKIAANLAVPDDAWPMSIEVDAGDQSLLLAPRPAPKPVLRWLAAAAAILAIAAGLTYRWVQPKDAPGPQQANRQITPVPPEGVKIVDDGKQTPKSIPPTFEDALSALEKRVSDGIDRVELLRAYESLLNDFPGHKTEIEGNPLLAKALAPPPEPAIVKTPPVKPALPATEPDRVALLARIADYAGKALAVDDARVRELREQVVNYQKQHPESKIPEFDTFVADAEPTAKNELRYAEARAIELENAPSDSAEVRELRNLIVTLRLRDETRPSVLQSKPIAGFMKLSQNEDPTAKEAEMKTAVVALVERLSQPKERGPYLLCVLPPAIRGEAAELYNNIQAFARKPGQQTDAGLMDFLALARRPIRQDTLGMIIPMYLYPDRNNAVPWDQVMALGNQGVRIKIIITPNFDVVQDGDILNYTNAIDRAHQNGIEVLGYVGCPGGKDGVTEAQGKVMKWHQLYPNRLDGLFFSQQSTDNAVVQPYAALYRYARGLERQWQIVAAPGSPCNEAFLTETKADILCPSINIGGTHTQGWEAKYDPERFAAIVYDVTDETLVPGFLMNATEKHFGWVCVVGKDFSIANTPYLGLEFRWIQHMNNLIMNRTDPVPARRNNPAPPGKSKAIRK